MRAALTLPGHPDEICDLDLRLLDRLLETLALFRMEARRLMRDQAGPIVAVLPPFSIFLSILH
jgi:hypothetical protein